MAIAGFPERKSSIAAVMPFTAVVLVQLVTFGEPVVVEVVDPPFAPAGTAAARASATPNAAAPRAAVQCFLMLPPVSADECVRNVAPGSPRETSRSRWPGPGRRRRTARRA